MAKFVKRVEPTQASYVFEFTQDEVDVLTGIVLDLSDPVRKVQMNYTVDESVVVPSRKGQEVLSSLAHAFEHSNEGGLDYDYFDFWDEVTD